MSLVIEGWRSYTKLVDAARQSRSTPNQPQKVVLSNHQITSTHHPTMDWQLHTPDETNDNIVAWWTPDTPPAPGQPLELAYRIHWQGDVQQRPPNGWTVQSRLGRGYAKLGPDELQLVVDFAGPALDALPKDAEVDAVVTPLANARLVERNAYRNEARGGWRMTVRVKRIDPAQPVELRAFLQQGSNALTETWTTLIPPD